MQLLFCCISDDAADEFFACWLKSALAVAVVTAGVAK